MNTPGDLVNKGCVLLRPGTAAAWGDRTFIVTGLHRSGTSLVASVLRRSGICMGETINDIVHEDEAFARLIEAREFSGLARLIETRNARYGSWGFKLPMLNQWLQPEQIALFRNPHVIVPFRDPLAIAQRMALSDYQDPLRALQLSIADLTALTSFIDALACPTLLVSYEKALQFPGEFVNAIIRFGSLPVDDALSDRLLRLVEPNRQHYIEGARRRYDGTIDGVVGPCLYGWCRLTGRDDPVELELFADDRPVLRFRADAFRQDLLQAGFGHGVHGFYVDVTRLGLSPGCIIRIKVAAHGIELANSGRPLAEYGTPASAAARHPD